MLMDLVDALSSNTAASSVVELSLNPHFRRHYTALNKAVTVNALTDQQLANLACLTIDGPVKRKFHLLGTDVTSNPRPYAETLPDRGFVYQPNTIIGIMLKYGQPVQQNSPPPKTLNGSTCR